MASRTRPVGVLETAALIRAFGRGGDQGLDASPLCFGEFHKVVPIIVRADYLYFPEKF